MKASTIAYDICELLLVILLGGDKEKKIEKKIEDMRARESTF